LFTSQGGQARAEEEEEAEVVLASLRELQVGVAVAVKGVHPEVLHVHVMR